MMDARFNSNADAKSKVSGSDRSFLVQVTLRTKPAS